MQRTLVFSRVEIDAVNRAVEVYETASGKSLNVARVLHTLGQEVLASGFVGGDSGRFIRAELSAAEIAHDFVSVTPKTRTCVTMIDQATGATTELVEESKQVDAAAWDALRGTIQSHLRSAKLVVLSGSLPPGAPRDFYRWCIERANESGAAVIVDAAGEPLRLALVAGPMIVKPNRSELAKTLGIAIETDAALRDAIKRLVESGAKWAVITEGKAGAVISDGEQFWRFRAPVVKAINPIGSGDSLAAGIACGIARGQDMLDAVKLGIACGAANAETITAGVVDRDRVRELTDRVEVEPW